MFYLDVGPLRLHEGLVDERALAPNLVVFRVELAAAVADLERKKITRKRSRLKPIQKCDVLHVALKDDLDKMSDRL